MNAPDGPSTVLNTTSLPAIPAPRMPRLDTSPGFLDRIADADLAEPTVANLLKLLPGPTLLHTVEARETPKYLAHLDRVLAALDFGSKYAGFNRDQAEVIDSVTERFGGGHLDDPDVVAVAEKYRLPRLLVGRRGPIGMNVTDPAHPDHDKMLRLFARQHITPNSSCTRMASLLGAAESRLGDHRPQSHLYARAGDHRPESHIYARALWYDDIPWNTCPGDKRKRERHAAAAGRIMERLRAYVAARSGMTDSQLIACPWAHEQLGTQQEVTAKLWKELGAATSYLTGVISWGQVPEGTETEMLVAEVVTRAQQAIAEQLPAELPAPRPVPEEEREEVPAGAVGSAVITDAEAEAEERARARESVLGSVRAKLQAKPDATDRELRQVGMSRFRKLVDMGELIKEAREQ